MVAARQRQRGKARKARASLAWLAALVAVASLFLRFSEPIFVDHTICEHGEITHRAAAPKAGEHRASSHGDGHHPDEKNGDRHDHCDALAGRYLAASSTAFVAPASLLLEIPYLGGLESPSDARRPPIESAPKTSPPAA